MRILVPLIEDPGSVFSPKTLQNAHFFQRCCCACRNLIDGFAYLGLTLSRCQRIEDPIAVSAARENKERPIKIRVAEFGYVGQPSETTNGDELEGRCLPGFRKCFETLQCSVTFE